jgi:hypothetical protein
MHTATRIRNSDYRSVTLRGEWRSNSGSDVVLIVEDETEHVREVIPATPGVLSKLLTLPGDFAYWQGRSASTIDESSPARWGKLVIARANTGEIITMDPEAFWEGVYFWFRSRGVDYDTPNQD